MVVLSLSACAAACNLQVVSPISFYIEWHAARAKGHDSYDHGPTVTTCRVGSPPHVCGVVLTEALTRTERAAARPRPVPCNAATYAA